MRSLSKQRKTKKKIPDSFIRDREPKFNKPIDTQQLKSKREEVKKALEQHEEAKATYEIWKEKFNKTESELNKKEEQLQERRANLEEFTDHHLAEIAKTKQLIEVQEKKNRLLREKLENLEEESAVERQRRNKLTNELQGLQRYTDFIQETVDKEPTFNTVEQLLNHYKSLQNTRTEYLLKYQNLITKYSEDTKTNQLMNEKRESYKIDRELKYQHASRDLIGEQQQSEYRKMELLKDIQRINDKSVLVASIKSSIRDLYKKAMSRIDVKHVDHSKLTEEEMLSSIKNRFSDLNEIIQAQNLVINQGAD